MMVLYIVCMIIGIAVVIPVNKTILPWKNEFQYLCTKQSLTLHKNTALFRPFAPGSR